MDRRARRVVPYRADALRDAALAKAFKSKLNSRNLPVTLLGVPWSTASIPLYFQGNCCALLHLEMAVSREREIFA
jgi:hypothetical protein